MTFTLRPYQSEAINAVYNYLRTHGGNPVVCLPTGSGKTPCVAQIVKDSVGQWHGKVLIVSHVAELLEQSAATLSRLAPEVTFGIYSASLKSRDTDYPCVIAGIQSVYQRAAEFGKIDLVIVDECHRMSPDDETTMYGRFVSDLKAINPDLRIIGFTATAFRTSSGMICSPTGIFQDICFEVGIRPLIVQGYISKLVSKNTKDAKVDTSKLHVRAGEFVQEEVEQLMSADDDLVAMACVEIGMKTEDRKSVLVFASSVEHAKKIQQMLTDVVGDGRVASVFGDTSSEARAETIRRFKAQELKYLVNVNVLSEGFDAPAVDAVCLMRPTMSPGLYYQQVGRGFRISPGKADCLVLDFAGNIFRHGPVDRMIIEDGKPSGGPEKWKECPDCQAVVERTAGVCIVCGHVFAKQEREKRGPGHDSEAADQSVLSGPETIAEIDYQLHEKRKDNGISRTLRVNYYCGLMHTPADFVCLEHVGFARQKAVAWWKARSSEPVPATVEEALKVIKEKGIKEPKQIVFRSEGPYLKAERYIDLTFNPNPHIVVVDRGLPTDDKAFTNVPL